MAPFSRGAASLDVCPVAPTPALSTHRAATPRRCMIRVMRLALAQINPTIGDLDGNAALIAGAIGRARAAGADLVVLPELAVSGYPPKDLLLQEGFVDACAEAAKKIGETATPGITAIFGVPL